VVCKIIRKKLTGTGFFYEIREKNIKLLVTNNHIIDDIYLEQGNKISYMISEKEIDKFYEIDLEKTRYMLTNKELDFTIIEILKEDNVQKFLNINDQPYTLKDEIFAYQFAGGVKLGFSFGNILEKNDTFLKYDVGTKGGSSGSPLLLMKNSKIIGLHKAGIIGENTEKLNIGIPITAIISKISYIKCIYEIKDINNNTQIINNTDGSEVNKDIENKIRILNNGREEKLIFTKKFDKIGMNVIYFSIVNKLNNMNFLFNNCSTLKKIDFISIETDEVIDMKSMFQSCCNLENLDLTNFNTAKVINMARMFKGCNKLKQIDGISKFNTYNVTNMREMFYSCNQLDNLDLSNFDISKVNDKELIFYECNKLNQIKGGEKLNQTKNILKSEASNKVNENNYDKESSGYNYSAHYNLYGFGFNSLNSSRYKIEEEEVSKKSRCSRCYNSFDSYGECLYCSISEKGF